MNIFIIIIAVIGFLTVHFTDPTRFVKAFSEQFLLLAISTGFRILIDRTGTKHLSNTEDINLNLSEKIYIYLIIPILIPCIILMK